MWTSSENNIYSRGGGVGANYVVTYFIITFILDAAVPPMDAYHHDFRHKEFYSLFFGLNYQPDL